MSSTSPHASRREFVTKSTAFVATAGIGTSVVGTKSATAAPEIFTLPCGIKYATLKPPKDKKKPQSGDIVAIEYTGYLTDGTIFGKWNFTLLRSWQRSAAHFAVVSYRSPRNINSIDAQMQLTAKERR
jgi:hypothetical protein